MRSETTNGRGWEKHGKYSARSAYAARFMGREVSTRTAFTWKPKAPLRCRFLAWLAICWTSDRLASRRLPHQDSCPMCNQQDETIQHLMLGCVFAKHVWFAMGQMTGRVELEHRQHEALEQWCTRQDESSTNRKATRAKCLLGMWMIWKHWNDIVFNGVTPSVTQTIQRIRDEGKLWAKAGLFEGEAQRLGVDLVDWEMSEP